MSLTRSILYLLGIMIPFVLGIYILPKLITFSKPIDSYRGVSVYSNGNDFTKSHGRHYHWSGYYFGQKWQCVEFIKRFYFLAKNHSMPNVWGHATHFFDPQIPHGSLNPDRNLLQFKNGEDTPPEPDDLIVFRDLTDFGHVAIITEVANHEIEIIQQNVGNQTRTRFPLIQWEQRYWVGDHSLQATGWLRVPPQVLSQDTLRIH